MTFFEEVKKKLLGEPEPNDPNYWRRNSGKKIEATILAPTEQEIKERNDTTNKRASNS